MKYFRYVLEKKGRKHNCPSCGKRRYRRFVDLETNSLIPEIYGRCDRENNCTYFLDPYTDGYAKRESKGFQGWNTPRPTRRPRPVIIPTSYIPREKMEVSLRDYDNNNFALFLKNLNPELQNVVIRRYNIGTSKRWDGATIFWQVDISGKVRTGKIMLYSPETGKRVKEPHPHFSWAHTQIENFQLKQCLFGEHLLKGNNNPVAIVESEKTAIVASTYFPKFIWLACGGLSNLSPEKCQVLKGRNVVLFPDLNAFEKWNEKAEILRKEVRDIKITVSKLLEEKCNSEDREKGLDIADYLISHTPKNEFFLKKVFFRPAFATPATPEKIKTPSIPSKWTLPKTEIGEIMERIKEMNNPEPRVLTPETMAHVLRKAQFYNNN